MQGYNNAGTSYVTIASNISNTIHCLYTRVITSLMYTVSYILTYVSLSTFSLFS